MTARNTYLRYGSVAMAFHWVIALLIIANVVLGLWFAEFLERGDPMKFEVAQWHKSIGLTVLVLSVLRVLCRVTNPQPPKPKHEPKMRFLSRASHFVLYVLIVILPLSGYVMVSASPLGNPTSYFGLFVIPNLPVFSGLTRAQLGPIHEGWEATHDTLAWISIVLVVIHISAALYHHLRLRDTVLLRMLPGTKVLS